MVFVLVKNESRSHEDLGAKMVRVIYTLCSIVAVSYLVSSAYSARSAQTTNKEYSAAGNLSSISGPNESRGLICISNRRT